MHSICVTVVFAALTALTAAAPHAIGHAHLHGSSPKLSLIAGRSVLNGACGGASGDMCQPGYCCSQYGYCGTSEDYCGAGCNSAFGTCGTTSSSPSSKSVQSSASATTVVVQSTVSEPSTTDSSTAAEATKFHPVPTWTTESYSAPATTSTSEPTVATTQSSTAPSSTSSTGSGSGSDSYKTYTGDGTTSAGWPSQDAWVNFDSMWSANLEIISISCTEFGQDNNSDEESDELKSAIQSIASSSGIDERFILAVVMQESKGCVRAPTTNYGVRNPGLMQDHDGTGTCNDATVSNPCPQSEIQQMIKDGVTGTAAGDGLEQCMTESGASDISKYYKAARIYNSGSVTDDNLGLGVATHCYASDIANRLTGWVKAPTSCTL